MTDPIADMFIRIKNAISCRQEAVEVPHSNIKEKIVKIFTDEGYLKSYENGSRFNKKHIRILLKYRDKKKAVIKDIQRISTPGRRVYKDSNSLKQVQGGFGTAVVSTSKGIMTDSSAREMKLGGEVLCLIW